MVVHTKGCIYTLNICMYNILYIYFLPRKTALLRVPASHLVGLSSQFILVIGNEIILSRGSSRSFGPERATQTGS